MNVVHILGRLTGDPELRKTQSGILLASFTVAVDRKGTDNGTDFIRCVAWRESGENIARYFVKGKPILLDGHLRIENYKNKNGDNRSVMDVVVERWYFVPADRTATDTSTSTNSSDDFQDVDGLDDLPF